MNVFCVCCVHFEIVDNQITALGGNTTWTSVVSTVILGKKRTMAGVDSRPRRGRPRCRS